MAFVKVDNECCYLQCSSCEVKDFICIVPEVTSLPVVPSIQSFFIVRCRVTCKTSHSVEEEIMQCNSCSSRVEILLPCTAGNFNCKSTQSTNEAWSSNRSSGQTQLLKYTEKYYLRERSVWRKLLLSNKFCFYQKRSSNFSECKCFQFRFESRH